MSPHVGLSCLCVALHYYVHKIGGLIGLPVQWNGVSAVPMEFGFTWTDAFRVEGT